MKWNSEIHTSLQLFSLAHFAQVIDNLIEKTDTLLQFPKETFRNLTE